MDNDSAEIFYSAPGRVCLYGEHQDYLKLTVIPAAINLRTTIGIRKNSTDNINIKSIELAKSDSFKPSMDLKLANNEFDYFRAIVKVLYNVKLIDKIPGFDLTIQSNVPIGSGLSSSAAILVAWLTALNGQLDLSLDKRKIADLCFIAENKILGVNCGIMDQYSSALGGLFSLDCDGPPYKIQEFTTDFKGLVIGDSKVRRAANEPLTLLKSQITNGMNKLASEDLNLKTITIEKLDSVKSKLSIAEYRRLYGAICIRNMTKEAAHELAKGKKQKAELLGELLTSQQKILSEYLEVSIPKLDLLVQESIKAGAKGAKLTGAGLGGCMVAFAPGKEKEVAHAIDRAGGKATICEIDFSGAQ